MGPVDRKWIPILQNKVSIVVEISQNDINSYENLLLLLNTMEDSKAHDFG